jgi:5-methylcytosine-specific restriction endonuclease McrA
MEEQRLLFPEDQEKDRLGRIFGTPEFKKRYRNYTSNSPKWKKLRQQVICRAKGRCERCGKIPKRIEIHHLIYDRFESELLSDLQLLCNEPCHVIADGERKAFNEWLRAERAEEARCESSRATYLEKRYGEEWMKRSYYDDGQMDRKFDHWYEKKNINNYFKN